MVLNNIDASISRFHIHDIDAVLLLLCYYGNAGTFAKLCLSNTGSPHDSLLNGGLFRLRAALLYLLMASADPITILTLSCNYAISQLFHMATAAPVVLYWPYFQIY